MDANEYRFVTRWRVDGTCGEVADIIGDPMSLTRWWPSVYLQVDELDPPGSRGVGPRVRLVTRGWLPYTLRWEFVVTESRYPFGCRLEAAGDLTGRGEWTFEQDGRAVNVTYDWQVHALKSVLRTSPSLFRPLFEANHRWAMRQGEESLKLELARRRAATDDLRRAVPPPPGPVTYAGIALIGGAALVAGTLGYLLLKRRPRSPRRSAAESKNRRASTRRRRLSTRP